MSSPSSNAKASVRAPAKPKQKSKKEKQEKPSGNGPNSGILISEKVRSALDRVQEVDGHQCIICTEAIEWFSIGKCNHRDLCSGCSIRRRILYKDTKCPMCMTDTNEIVITNSKDKKFEQVESKIVAEDSYFQLDKSISLDGEEAKAHFENLRKRLWELRCPLCDNTSIKNVEELKKHVKQAHSVQFCKLCLEERKVFLQEQKLYNQRELQKHQESGDKDTLVKHEHCKFCKKKLFFDIDKLYEHLRDAHLLCSLCDKLGTPHQYFADYANLEHHFKEAHFLCDQRECLDKKFVVFLNELDLQSHMITVHMNSKPRSQIKSAAQVKVDFAVKSTNVSERKEEVPVAPVEIPHPENDFPVLITDNSKPLVNTAWSKPFREKTSEDHFPELPTKAPSKPQVDSVWHPTSNPSSTQTLPPDPIPVVNKSKKQPKKQVLLKFGAR